MLNVAKAEHMWSRQLTCDARHVVLVPNTPWIETRRGSRPLSTPCHLVTVMVIGLSCLALVMAFENVPEM